MTARRKGVIRLPFLPPPFHFLLLFPFSPLVCHVLHWRLLRRIKLEAPPPTLP